MNTATMQTQTRLVDSLQIRYADTGVEEGTALVIDFGSHV